MSVVSIKVACDTCKEEFDQPPESHVDWRVNLREGVEVYVIAKKWDCADCILKKAKAAQSR